MRGIRKLLDRRWVKSADNIGPDFAGPGINLYYVEWLKEASNVDTSALGTTTAFLSDEIKRRYPHIIAPDDDGFEWIVLDSTDLNNDKDLKKIFLICSAGLWMIE